MSEKDKFKSPRARYTGDDILGQTESVRNEFMNRYSSDEAETKNHTLRLSPGILERMKDYVYFQKLNGHPFYSQGELVETALNKYLSGLGIDIPERPTDVKNREGRRTGRKRKIRSNYPSNNGLNLD